MIDLWYKEHILNKDDTNHNQYSSYLDTDEIFCNNRSSENNYGVWNQTGDITTYLNFVGEDTNNSGKKVSCVDLNNQERVIDEFSVTSGNESLTYPIGLPSYAEMYIQTMSTSASPVRKSPYGTGVMYWLASPNYFTYSASERTMNSSGNLSSSSIVNYAYGARPSVSLNRNVLFSEGDGTMTNPWIASLE